MKVKIDNITSRRWRNENPGEGGITYTGRTVESVTMPNGTVFPAGSEVGLGGDGYKIVAVSGGWISVPVSAKTTAAGEVNVTMFFGRLIAV